MLKNPECALCTRGSFFTTNILDIDIQRRYNEGQEVSLFVPLTEVSYADSVPGVPNSDRESWKTAVSVRLWR